LFCAGLGAKIRGEQDAKQILQKKRVKIAGEKQKTWNKSKLQPGKMKPDLPVECTAPWEGCGRVVRLLRKGQKDIW